MCCVVQIACFEKFVTQPEKEDCDFPSLVGFPTLSKHDLVPKITQIVRSSGTYLQGTMETCKNPTSRITTKRGDSCDNQEYGKQKKKKKWKKLPFSETGFNLSLFPRPSKGKDDPEEEEKLQRAVENALEDYESLLSRVELSQCREPDDVYYNGVYPGKLLRRDRHRGVQKAGRQVKDKYCRSLKNNDGRKKLHIHHRLFKLINLERKIAFLPSPKHYTKDIAINKSTNETRSKLKESNPGAKRSGGQKAPVQNLRHTLHETNAPSELESSLVQLLISLQHRELTPEDYDLLLQLDDSVAPRTVHDSFLSALRTDMASAADVSEVCPVCMDQYQAGQSRKWLPCQHVFHAACIDTWLQNASRNCPVDGLPVDQA